MTRALTLGILLCALALTACDHRSSPSPPMPQTSKAEKAAAALARAAAESKYPAPSGRFMIDDDTDRGPKQPIHTNYTTACATCDVQSYAAFDHCPSGQMFDQRFSICVMEDVCGEIKS